MVFCASSGQIWNDRIESLATRYFRGLYLLLALFLEVQLLRYKPQHTWRGLVIILSGVAIY